MDDRLIKIKKPAGSLRGLFETLKSFLLRLVGRPRVAKAKAAPPGRRPRTLPARQVPNKGNGAIQIRIGQVPDNDSSRGDAVKPAPPILLRRRQPGGRINLDAVTHVCKACGERFADGDRRSTCSRDSRHFVHTRCKEIMRHRCPHCGGTLV